MRAGIAIASLFRRSVQYPYAPLLYALPLFAFSLWLNLGRELMPDNAWLLLAARRFVEGERLYADLLETNPPLILWLDALPIRIANLFSISDTAAFIGCIIVLIAGSMTLSLRELRGHPVLGQPVPRMVFMLACAWSMLLCGPLLFGEREHVWMILLAPYLVQSLIIEREPQWTLRQGAIVLMAALGTALKPYFVLVWAANEAFLAISRRDPLWLLRPTNIVITVLGMGYLAAAWIVTPEYFTVILPALIQSYDAYDAPYSVIITILLALAVLYAAIYLRCPHRDFLVRQGRQLATVFTAACVVFWLQHKGWYYHCHGAMFFGTLLSAVALLRLFLSPLKPDRKERRHALVMGLLIAAGCSVLPFMSVFNALKPDTPIIAARTLQGLIATHARGENIAVFSFDLGVTFPAAFGNDAHFRSAFGQQWMLPMVMMAEQKAKKEAEQGSEGRIPPGLERQKAFILRVTVEGFIKHLPALVWVDNNENTKNGLENADIIAFFKQDARFAQAWRHYRKLTDIVALPPKEHDPGRTYTVYLRDPTFLTPEGPVR